MADIKSGFSQSSDQFDTLADKSKNLMANDTPMDTPLETPLTSEGYGMTSGLSSDLAASSPYEASSTATLHSAAQSLHLGTIRDQGTRLVSMLDSQARQNPWLSVGLIGVGALAVGYILGRALPTAEKVQTIRGFAREHDRFGAGNEYIAYETFQGYDE